MGDAIIVAIIAGAVSLIGNIITVLSATHKTEENLKISQAVTDTKLDNLTREVRTHNNFAQRVPVMEEQIKVINHRIEDLEQSHAREGA